MVKRRKQDWCPACGCDDECTKMGSECDCYKTGVKGKPCPCGLCDCDCW